MKQKPEDSQAFFARFSDQESPPFREGRMSRIVMPYWLAKRKSIIFFYPKPLRCLMLGWLPVLTPNAKESSAALRNHYTGCIDGIDAATLVRTLVAEVEHEVVGS